MTEELQHEPPERRRFARRDCDLALFAALSAVLLTFSVWMNVF